MSTTLCTCKPRSSGSGFRYDRYIAVQVKSAIGAATKTREEITKKLMDKLDEAARNLAKKDFEFDAFVFHTADEVDIVPDNGGRVLRAPLCPDEQAPWLEKLPGGSCPARLLHVTSHHPYWL